MNKRLLLILMALLCFEPVFAQNVDEDDNYASEFTYGITLSTTGGIPSGFILKNARFIKDRWYHVFFLEIMNVKHPKEYRSNNFTQTYGGAFVYDKLNNFYVIRPQYGREYVLFRKAAEQGVQIDAILAGGPSLGFLKPYYIQYVYSNSDVRTERYDPNIHPSSNAIAGNGGFWNGLGESKLQIGANLKAGITFEFGAFRNSVTGFDLGFMVDAYPNKIEIMSKPENFNVFTSAYFTLFFGSRR